MVALLGDTMGCVCPKTPGQRRPTLVVVGGLPATGKTTIARAAAAELRAAYVRIDTIETAISRSEGAFEATNGWELPPGYVVGYDVAAEQLRIGTHVVAESVNAFAVTRDAWRDAGTNAGAHVVEVEVVCSDADEHRRRAESRVLDVPGLASPTWDAIMAREYEPWGRDRLVVDTARLGVAEAVQLVLNHLAG